MIRTLVHVLAGLCCAAFGRGQGDVVVVGSKNFTESAVLAEIIAQTIEAHTDLTVERRINLGGTKICWDALRAGEIDIYAEYTGTAWVTHLGEREKAVDPLRAYLEVRRRCMREHDVEWLEPFGFENTYAIAMAESKAAALGIERVSDLRDHQADLRAGFSIEFGSREDGLLGLARTYDLDFGSVRTLEHGLAYEALANDQIDVIDAYSTDGKLLRYRLRTLDDDRGFFPPYHAAPVVHGPTLRAHPEIRAALERLAFRIPARTAQSLNLAVESGEKTVPQAAADFLDQADAVDEGEEPSRSHDLARLPGLILEHLVLTLAAVALAALVAIPLGIVITRRPRLRRLALGFAGVVQTIPSLALLAFMIPVLGLSVQAAIAALFLYAMLPILRNTYTGIVEVDADLVDAARGMGMRPLEVLVKVQLPLASRMIMAGVRTSTVIGIGVATLAAFIGAGGLGEPILEGLYLNDTGLILTGAVPAALLAIVADTLLTCIERTGLGRWDR